MEECTAIQEQMRCQECSTKTGWRKWRKRKKLKKQIRETEKDSDKPRYINTAKHDPREHTSTRAAVLMYTLTLRQGVS